MTTDILGHLHIDHQRGVVYFHSSVEEVAGGRCPTPLRIQGLGQLQYPQKDRQIDIGIQPVQKQSIHTRTGKERATDPDEPILAKVMISK